MNRPTLSEIAPKILGCIDRWIMRPRPCHKCGKLRKPVDPAHEECDQSET